MVFLRRASWRPCSRNARGRAGRPREAGQAVPCRGPSQRCRQQALPSAQLTPRPPAQWPLPQRQPSFPRARASEGSGAELCSLGGGWKPDEPGSESGFCVRLTFPRAWASYQREEGLADPSPRPVSLRALLATRDGGPEAVGHTAVHGADLTPACPPPARALLRGERRSCRGHANLLPEPRPRARLCSRGGQSSARIAPAS